eukprot:4854122-Ditylum_brightwellii.AAC.1
MQKQIDELKAQLLSMNKTSTKFKSNLNKEDDGSEDSNSLEGEESNIAKTPTGMDIKKKTRSMMSKKMTLKQNRIITIQKMKNLLKPQL